MRGRTLSGIPLMLVTLVLCLLSSSIIVAGEHPWDRDYNPGTSGGSTPTDTTIVRTPISGVGCVAGTGGSAPTTEQSRLSWQSRLVMRVSYYVSRFMAESPRQYDQKRVQSNTEQR